MTAAIRTWCGLCGEEPDAAGRCACDRERTALAVSYETTPRRLPAPPTLPDLFAETRALAERVERHGFRQGPASASSCAETMAVPS